MAAYQGVPLHEGSRAVEGYVSKVHTKLVRPHKAAGLLTVGKVNTPEFGSLSTTEPQRPYLEEVGRAVGRLTN